MTLLSFVARLGIGYALIRAVPDAGISSMRMVNSGLTFASLVAMVLSTVFLAVAAPLVPGADEIVGYPVRMALFTVFVVVGTIDALQSFEIGRAHV